MTKKLIVADDSQTIQKVIKITFANKDYELVPCLDEKSTMDSLSDDISLVLLDFSLSETKSGYELVKEVKAKLPHVPVLGMLGTFDTVDEENFKSAGYDDKVVKPFETDKFISKCEFLIDNGSIEVESVEVEEEEEEIEASDDWSIESPQFEESEEVEEEVEEVQAEESSDELSKELDGWGLGANPALAQNDVTSNFEEFPPVIEGSSESIATTFLSAENLIDEEDLAPIEEVVDSLVEQEVETTEVEALEEGSQESSDDFWSVDEHVSETFEEAAPEQEILGTTGLSVEEVTQNSASPETDNFDIEPLETVVADSEPVEELDDQELRQKVTADLTPMIEKYVKEYCSERLEQVAWEIIPDLAENLIKKELKEISKNILQSMND